uniref:Obscurin like cytoskeletal adaptor 1 n=1 Tax=Apteryx owenii TaxID=8824 RepID=A0A8B9PSF4_APTOW
MRARSEAGMDGFGGAPRFLAYPRTFTVQNGADAVLKCQIAGDPRPSILWEKDRTPIEPSGRFHVEAKGNVYSLLVSRVTPEDSGLYVCKAKNNVGETYAAATLKVEAGEPQEEGDPENKPPVFLVRPSSMRVCRGEDVMFTCRVSGQPCPALHWEKDGHKLSDLFESSHFSVGKEPEDWHFLKLFSARPPDGGVYVCRARSGSQEALAAAVLLVEPLQPGERQQRHRHAFAVSAGKHAKFRCYVTGKPKPEITWKKDGKPVTPGRRHLVYEDREGYFILKVLYCKPQDQGLYICTASNTAGQTLSAVQLQVKEHRMRFQVQLADVEVQEREDAVLECHVPLENIPTAWYLEDKELQPSHKYVMEEQGVVRRLTIRDARTDDDGIYLCQMKDKGRSIAEVSVRGMIVKRLPRKLDVMEGENAAFCVETREAVEGICWSRNGQELQESSRTVLKSFGRTHLLVLVHVTREEAGVISFAVAESQTSSQLRVKCVKRDPPSTPVAARMSTEHSNAALLTWCPAPDVHHCPPSSYVLERQEVSASEWVHCLTTDLASLVEVLGDSVPCEADYRFRICAVNKYGRSGPVEFPGSVHLVPAARLERGLQDVLVQDGEDAHFSLELSASVRGAWFLNGTRLGDEEGTDGRYCVQHCKTEHSLLIRGARLAESGAQVTFVSTPQAHIAPVLEAQRLRKQPAGLPVLLECEVSPPGAPVRWLKDGEAVPLDDVIAVQAEGCVRRLLVRSAGPSDSGIYTCDAGDEAVSFVVTVTEPPVRIVSSNEDAPHAYAAQERVVLWCELSRADAPVCWYKDGLEVEVGESLVLEREGPQCRLVLPCAQPQDTGEFVCDAGGDSVFYNPPVRIVSSNEDAPHAYAAQERVVLWCELSRADAPVCWYKDGLEVEVGESLVLEREGPQCRLVLPCAQPQDTGEFVCDAGGDSVFYNVTVAEPPVRIVSSNEDAPHAYAAQERVVLWCELSRADAPVCWYKDGLEVEVGESLVLEREGPQCRLVLPCAQPQDTGEFVCDAGDASASYSVTVAEPRVRILHPLQRSLALPVLALARVELQCELSVPDAPVRWFKDGLEVDESNNLLLLTEGAQRRLVILKASVEDAGEYICESRDEAVSFDVQVSELPVKILQPQRPPPVVKASPGETVMLACELSRADAPVCWAKDGVRLEAGGSLVLEEEGAHRRLLIPAARVEHSGKYVCDTIEDAVTFTIQVSDPLVRILERDALPTRRHCRALEDLVLEVHLSHAHGEVKWYKDGEKLQDTGHVWLEEDGARRSLVVLGATLRDAGEYLCDTRDDSIIFCVTVEGERHSPRCLPGAEEAPELLVLEGGSAVLSAIVSKEPAPVMWLGPRQPVAAGERCELRREGRVHSLVLSNVSKEDAGVYTCLSPPGTPPARGSACRHMGLGRVAELLVKFLRGLADMHVHEGETVVLWCELCKAKGDVVWLKDGRELAPSPRREIKVEGRERSLVLSNVGPEDAGEYSCESNDDRTLATLTVQGEPQTRGPLHSLTVLEGEDATFKCVVSPEDVALTWQLNGQAVAPCERLVVARTGLCHSLTIRQCQLADVATVTANAEGLVSAARLSVQEAQVLFVRRLQDVAAEEQQDVCLEVEVSHEAAEVQWMKQGVVLQPGGKYELQESGRRRTLTIRSLSPSDRGTYRCESLHDRTQAKLCVEREYLRDVETFEKETATFHLELSHAGVPGVWTRDGIRVKPSGTCQISAAGCAHSLTLQRLTLEDSGTVAFTADTLRCSARLLVRALPIRIVKPLRDKTVLARHKATLECTVSHARGRVRWFRGNTEIFAGDKYEICNLDCYRTLIIHHVGPEDEDSYTCDAFDDRSTARLLVEGEPWGAEPVRGPRTAATGRGHGLARP